MINSTPGDGAIPAEQRGVPEQMEVYRVDISSGGVKAIVLPRDIKVAAFRSPVAGELSLSYKRGDAYSPDPGDLTGGSDVKKLPIEAGTREPLAQEREFNTFHFLPSETSAEPCLIWVGAGKTNPLITGAGYVGA